MSFAPSDLVPDDLQRHDRIGITYQSGAYRAENLARRMILNGQAVERFEPPPPPPGAGMVWDAEALAARSAFLVEKSELSRAFTEQATSREWTRIEQRLVRAKSALEAVAVLHEMRTFLTTDPLRTQIDARAALELLSRVKLPFERLVRNVWVEGPEVQYDRAKAHICSLLEAAIDARDAHEQHVRSGGSEPRREVEQLVHNLRLQWRARQATREVTREAARPKFAGMKYERERPTSVAASQRALLASFRSPA